MVVHLLGYQDAATYNQWRELGRQVKRGSKAFYLMKPHLAYRTVEDELTGERTRIPAYIKGFGWFPVFAYESTLPLPGFQGKVYCLEPIARERKAFVANLPLAEVAEAWGIHDTTYRGHENDAFGWAIPGRSIDLGVANLSTWAHELVHRSFQSPSEAEHRLGTLTVGNGQDRENEIVAELGGAVLLTVLGHKAQGCLQPAADTRVVEEPSCLTFPQSLAKQRLVGAVDYGKILIGEKYAIRDRDSDHQATPASHHR